MSYAQMQLKRAATAYVRNAIDTSTWREQVAYLVELAERTSVDFEAHANRTPKSHCAHCGSLIEWSDGTTETDRYYADGSVYCSVDCAEADGCAICENCGDPIDHEEGESLYIDYENYCSSDCARDAGYECCDECGEWYTRDDGEEIEQWTGRYTTYYNFCSERCAVDHGFRRCENCDEWVHEDYTHEVRTSNGWEVWCENCGEDTFTCERCDNTYSEDLYGGDGLCERCYNRNISGLHEYGWTPILTYYGITPGHYTRNTPLLGIELETDSGEDRRAYVQALSELDGFNERFWMTKDSSLNNGVEITSHPMTLAYHEEIVEMYRAFYTVARRYGYVSHNSGNCGLHVHVNREFFGQNKAVQDAGGYKMLRALQRFERQFTIFSRRQNNDWCGYRTREDFTPKKKAGHIEYSMRDMLRKANTASANYEHSQCLNFQHGQTFEFRIFRGTLKTETLFACFGLVNGLCHTAKAHGSVWFETKSWYDLRDEMIARCDNDYARECLVEYLEEKGL